MERRRFLKQAAAAVALAGPRSASVEEVGSGPAPGIDRDPIIRKAFAEGIDFLDNPWDYKGDVSEERIRKSSQDTYRHGVCLMTQIDGRTGAEAC